MTQPANPRKAKPAKDPLSVALRSSDLDETLRVIVNALGIPNGAVIRASFTEKDRETYRELLNCYRRAEFIKSWIAAEIDQAAERVGQNG